MAERVQVTGNLYHGVVPDGAVYVGRPTPGLPGSKWANPFKIGKPVPAVVRLGGHSFTLNTGRAGDTLGAIGGFTPPGVGHVIVWYQALIDALELREQIRAELAGRDLACWCRPSAACHVDVLLAVANV